MYHTPSVLLYKCVYNIEINVHLCLKNNTLEYPNEYITVEANRH